MTYSLEPAAARIATLVGAVTEDQLDAATPCADYTVRDLLGHLQGLTVAFRGAALRAPDPGGPDQQPGKLLADDWRTLIPARAAEMAEAWRAPDAWRGETAVGGLSMPAELVGKIGLNELLLHGWDLASAIGRPFDADPASVAASLEFTTLVNSPAWTVGRTGLFGDVVAVPADAPPLHRTLGLSGRNPNWGIDLKTT